MAPQQQYAAAGSSTTTPAASAGMRSTWCSNRGPLGNSTSTRARRIHSLSYIVRSPCTVHSIGQPVEATVEGSRPTGSSTCSGRVSDHAERASQAPVATSTSITTPHTRIGDRSSEVVVQRAGDDGHDPGRQRLGPAEHTLGSGLTILRHGHADGDAGARHRQAVAHRMEHRHGEDQSAGRHHPVERHEDGAADQPADGHLERPVHLGPPSADRAEDDERQTRTA